MKTTIPLIAVLITGCASYPEPWCERYPEPYQLSQDYHFRRLQQQHQSTGHLTPTAPQTLTIRNNQGQVIGTVRSR